MRVRFAALATWGFLLALGVLLAAASTARADARTARFYDPDGNPLPFSTFAEVEDFLRSAEIVSMEKMSAGTNKRKRKVVLRQGNHRAKAILRTGYEIKDTPGGGFVDSYMSELAAYEMAGLLGMDTVPPVVRRKGGSLQIWIENATTDAARRKAGQEPADRESFERQMADLYAFDNLIANTDRNPGNILIDGDGKVWLIDHTRSFAGQEELRYADKLTGCNRDLLSRLQSLSDGQIEQKVGPYVKKYLPALKVRRGLLLDAMARQCRSSGPGGS